MLGACFASIPHELRKQMGEGAVCLARVLKLDRDHARSKSHFPLLERDLMLEDHPDIVDGLVDGKWGFPEGISVAFGLNGFLAVRLPPPSHLHHQAALVPPGEYYSSTDGGH